MFLHAHRKQICSRRISSKNVGDAINKQTSRYFSKQSIIIPQVMKQECWENTKKAKTHNERTIRGQ